MTELWHKAETCKFTGIIEDQIIRDRLVLGIWDDKVSGIKYVKMDEFNKLKKWNEACLIIENRRPNATKVDLGLS